MSEEKGYRKVNNKKNSDAVNNNLCAYNEFIEKYRIYGEGVEYTHTSFGKPWGKYYIPDDKLDEFYNLYGKIMGKVALHITERPKEFGPLLIDIDMKFNESKKQRHYTEKDIAYLITKVHSIIISYSGISKKILKDLY